MRGLGLILFLLPLGAEASPDGALLLAKYECQRCHEGSGVAAIAEDRHCVRCHQAILEDRFEAPKAAIDKWQKSIVSLRVAPSLNGVGMVLQEDWVRSYLLAPHELRPNLRASMPRLSMSPEDAAVLAKHLVPKDAAHRASGAAPNAKLAEEGRALYQKYRCADCHAFSGSGEGLRSDSPYRAHEPNGVPANAMALAPDLRFVRERFQPAVLSGWIQDPRAFRPDTLMPSLSLSSAEAERLAAFVWHAPLEDRPEKPMPVRPPVLTRRVTYAEVEARVLRKVCWHCHSSPDFNHGDGGPGNTGGFGFAPRGLDLSSYESTTAGLLGLNGRRQSVFARTDAGIPRLLAALLARQSEERGLVIPGVRGMPLGLPSLPDEDIQLVEAWILQGRPR